jgi:hypothetical protein
MKRKNKAIHEIVRVVEPAFLVNSLKQACRYETSDGQPLTPGYYFVLWPAGVEARIYTPVVRYFGPFDTLQEAALVQRCAEFLGIARDMSFHAFQNSDCDDMIPTAAVNTAYIALLQVAQGVLASTSARSPLHLRYPATRPDQTQHAGGL